MAGGPADGLEKEDEYDSCREPDAVCGRCASGARYSARRERLPGVASGEAVSSVASHIADYSYRHDYDVDWWLPKFDVTGTAGGLGEKLIPGIGDMEQALDFTPLLGEREREPLVPRCSCGARVKIDEEGMEASGYAMCAVVAAAIPDLDPPIIPFIVDRPFAFVLVSSTKEPMFIGLVNCPEGY